MATHSSATVRLEKPHANQTTRTNTIINALKRRAHAVLNDSSIDAQSRAIIRYALETNDPWLARLLRRADAGETIIDTNGLLEAPANDEDDASEEKIEALVEMICRAGDEPETKSAALLVLMATLENARHPKAAANKVKHFAFTRCGQFNLDGIVDAQVTQRLRASCSPATRLSPDVFQSSRRLRRFTQILIRVNRRSRLRDDEQATVKPYALETYRV